MKDSAMIVRRKDLITMKNILLEEEDEVGAIDKEASSQMTDKLKRSALLCLEFSYEEKDLMIHMMKNIFDLTLLKDVESERTMLFFYKDALISIIFDDDENAEDSMIDDFSIKLGYLSCDEDYIDHFSKLYTTISKEALSHDDDFMKVFNWREDFNKHLNDKISEWDAEQTEGYRIMDIDKASELITDIVFKEAVIDELMIDLPRKSTIQIVFVGGSFQIKKNQLSKEIDEIENEISMNYIWNKLLPVIKSVETKEQMRNILQSTVKNILKAKFIK